MKSKILFFIIILTFLIYCGKQKHEEEHVHKEDEHNHLHISEIIVKKWGIKYAKPEKRDYTKKIALTGIVKENKNNTFFVHSLVSGSVTKIKKDIGDQVKSGDSLCILNSQELLTLKAKYIKAFQNYRLTKENYQRAKNLFKVNAIEKKELINRETAYKTTLADYFSFESELISLGFDKNLLETIKNCIKKDDFEKLKKFLTPFFKIRAPSSGKVMARDLNLGERIEKNRTIFEISDTRRIWVILDAMERDLKYIEKEGEIKIHTDLYPKEIIYGKVTNIFEKIDPELRTNKIRVETDNKKYLLKPEMYVMGNIEKKIKKEFLSLPQSSIVKLSGVSGVFLKEGDGFKFKPVEIIDTDSSGFVFVKGIKENDLIVVKGAFYLKAEYEIKRGEIDEHAGHQH